MKKIFLLLILATMAMAQEVIQEDGANLKGHQTFAIAFDVDSNEMDTVGPIDLFQVTHFSIGYLPSLLTGNDSAVAAYGFQVDIRTSFSSSILTMSKPDSEDSTLKFRNDDTLRITTGNIRKGLSLPASKYLWIIAKRIDDVAGKFKPTDKRFFTVSVKRDEPVR